MGAVAAAVIIRKEKDLVAHFVQARALSIETAQSLGTLRIDEGVGFRRLRERAVIREGAPGAFYLDEPSWEALRRTRLRMVTVMLLVALTLGISLAIVSANRVGH